jgi:hypothetical protein
MRIDKIIQTRVSLTDPSSVLSPNVEGLVLDVLRSRYVGKCYASCLILEVREIIELSNLIFSRQRQDASISCNVRFSVSGVAYNVNEIIHDCKVINVDKDGHKTCKSEHAAIVIKASNRLQSIREGQVIPVVVGLKYTLGSSAVSVNAFPFIPRKREKVRYNMVGEASPVINELLKQLDSVVAECKTLPPKVYDHFVSLMYPYKDASTAKKETKGGTIMTLHAVVKAYGKKKNLQLEHSDALHMKDMSVVVRKFTKTAGVTNKTSDGKKALVVNEKYVAVMGSIIQSHIEYFTSVKKLCTSYSTMGEIKSNNNLWTIYKSSRY